MRRYLIVTLLVTVPLQFAWGAAGNYCPHEGGDRVGHAAHRAHGHGGKSLVTTDHSTSDQKTDAGDGDSDSGHCHPTCAQLLASTGQELAKPPTQNAMPIDLPGYHSRPADTIERPNWLAGL